MNTMLDVSVRDRLDFIAELEARGVHFPRGVKADMTVLCPVHPERTPSCHLTLKEGGRWLVKCFGCQFEGDEIDLLAAIDGVPVERWMAEFRRRQPGVYDTPPRPRRALTPRPADEPPPFTPAQLKPWAAECSAALWADTVEARNARRYLYTRGVRLDTEARQFGFGLGVPWGDDGCKLGSLAGRLVLAMFPHGAEGRIIPPGDYTGTGRPDSYSGVEPAWNAEAKYVSLGPKRAWGLDSPDPTQPLVLVEGIFDRIALARFEIQAAALRSKNLQEVDVKLIAKAGFTDAAIMLDADASADDIVRIGERLRTAGVRPRPVYGIKDGDAGDLLALSDDEALRRISEALREPVE